LVEAGADVQFVGELRHSLEEVYLSLINSSSQETPSIPGQSGNSGQPGR